MIKTCKILSVSRLPENVVLELQQETTMCSIKEQILMRDILMNHNNFHYFIEVESSDIIDVDDPDYIYAPGKEICLEVKDTLANARIMSDNEFLLLRINSLLKSYEALFEIKAETDKVVKKRLDVIMQFTEDLKGNDPEVENMRKVSKALYQNWLNEQK